MRRSGWILLAVIAIGAGMVPFLRKGTSELPVYTTGAERMLAQEEVYRRDEPKAFTYPPFFAVPFVPFTLLPSDQNVQRAAWYVLNVAALVGVFVLLWRIARPALSSRREAIWFWVAFLALTARHVAAVFQNQSHDLLICFAAVLAAVAWGRGLGTRAGAWAGLGAACKATPLLFGLPFVMQRRVGPLVGIGVSVLLLTLLPDLLFPRLDGRLWGQAWYEIMVAGIGVGDAAAREGVWHPGSFLNQSLSGTLARLTTSFEPSLRVLDIAPIHLGEGARKVVIGAGQLGIVAWIAIASWRRVESDERRPLHCLGLASLVACGMVLLSPMSSKSHFCVLVLPAAYCLARWRQDRDAVLKGLLIAAFVVGTLTTKGVLGRNVGEFLLACGAVTWGTVLLLAATARGMRRA